MSNPRANGVIVGALSRSFAHGSGDLRNVPPLLVRVIKEDMWRYRLDPDSGREYGPFETFNQFVEASTPDGLGGTVEQLRKICHDNPEARDLLDQALQRPVGAYEDQGDVDNIHVFKVTRPDGTSEAAALRRLRKDRPDLHAEVLAGRMTAHAAMVQAGFRRRSLSVPIDRPERIANVLRKHMTPADLERLAELLRERPR